MLGRTLAVTYNTYREAVRARILHGLLALALFSVAYSVVVANYASKSALRVISDLGAFSLSSFAVAVALIMGATSLYREVELKTVFPILARPIRRGEYLLGKFFGTLLTLAVFMCATCGVLLCCLSIMAGASAIPVYGGGLAVVVVAAIVAWKFPKRRTLLPIPVALAVFFIGLSLSAGVADERRVVLASAVLSLFEVSIVTALANLFAAFSSPFLSAVLVLGVFLVGRSADTLANLPSRVFGQPVTDAGRMLSSVFPNLMVYVPERSILLGNHASTSLADYLGLAGAQALAWTVLLLVCAAALFRRRDFI